jgi:hypothetical protein
MDSYTFHVRSDDAIRTTSGESEIKLPVAGVAAPPQGTYKLTIFGHMYSTNPYTSEFQIKAPGIVRYASTHAAQGNWATIAIYTPGNNTVPTVPFTGCPLYFNAIPDIITIRKVDMTADTPVEDVWDYSILMHFERVDPSPLARKTQSVV